MNKLFNVLKIWLIVYPLITIVQYGMQDWLIQHAIFVRTLILSGIMVFGLQYLIFPVLNKFQKQNH
ncbi:MAG: hypothetical protein AAFQ94_22595 [Bacteroidota bacterium]